MASFFGFDLLIGILALQGIIADILILFGAGFVLWLWLSDRKLNKKTKQMEASEYEGLKRALYKQIDTILREQE